MNRAVTGVLALAVALPAAVPSTGAAASTAVGAASGRTPAVGVEVLPALPGDTETWAGDVNEAGTVAGLSGGTDSSQAVVWRRRVPRALGALPGATTSVAYGLNDRGQVVGLSGGHAVLWSAGRVVDLGTLPGGELSLAEDVSDDGVVAGWSTDAAGSVRPVVWRHGRITELPLPSGVAGGRASDVAESGVVVGAARTAQKWVRTAGVSRVDLGALPGDDQSAALSVNRRGHAAGYSLRTGALWTPVTWDRAGVHPLALPAPDAIGMAEDLNDGSRVVGWVQRPGGTALPALWCGGRLHLLPTPSGTYGQATAVNDSGVVVGVTLAGATLWSSS